MLTMTVDRPPSVTLTSSGEPGVTFDVGGSIVLTSSTADGTLHGHDERHRRLSVTHARAARANFPIMVDRK